MDSSAEKPGVMLYSPDGHLRSLRQIEADLISLAMCHYHGHISNIAHHLDIGRSTLYRKLDALGISGK